MTIAEKLFIACVRDKDQKTLSKVKGVWTDTKEFKQLRFITDYIKDHSELPGLNEFVAEFKHDPKLADAKPLHYLAELKRRFIYTGVAEQITPLLRKMDKKNPEQTIADIKVALSNLDTSDYDSKDIRYASDTKSRLDEYERKRNTRGVTHLSTGSTILDKYWFGYKKADLVTIGGRSGMGKTWLIILLCILMEIPLPEDAGDILFVSNEMPEDEVMERFDSVRFKLPYGKFLAGELNRGEYARYKRGLEKLEKNGSRIVFVYNCNTLDELETKIGLYKPSIVFLDGSYLMESQLHEGWEKIVYITRNLKRLAKNHSTPIVNTTQLKKSAGKASHSNNLDGQDEFAYGSSFLQDSDIAVRMFQDKDMIYDGVIGMDHVKGRRLPKDLNIQFAFDLENMILEILEAAEEPITTKPTVDF